VIGKRRMEGRTYFAVTIIRHALLKVLVVLEPIASGFRGVARCLRE
jgi:hypothetical protein